MFFFLDSYGVSIFYFFFILSIFETVENSWELGKNLHNMKAEVEIAT